MNRRLWKTYRTVVILIVAVVLIVLMVGIVLLLPRESKETERHMDANQIEQHDDVILENADSKQDDENDSSGLEVLPPQETAPENSTDASGSWGDEPEQEMTDIPDTKEDGDILKDDITWGDIY